MKLVCLFLVLLLGAAVINASPTAVNIRGFGTGGGMGLGMGGGGQGFGTGGGALGPSEPLPVNKGADHWKGTVRPIDKAFVGVASKSKFADRRMLQHGPDSWEWEGGPGNTWRDTVGVKAGVKGGVVGKPMPDTRFDRPGNE
jgi:hypothetical protein